jgi:hypothetical protein
VFRTQEDDELTQDMYRVRHQYMDDVDLFLVPIGPSRGSQHLEAVFG